MVYVVKDIIVNKQRHSHHDEVTLYTYSWSAQLLIVRRETCCMFQQVGVGDRLGVRRRRLEPA